MICAASSGDGGAVGRSAWPNTHRPLRDVIANSHRQNVRFTRKVLYFGHGTICTRSGADRRDGLGCVLFQATALGHRFSNRIIGVSRLRQQLFRPRCRQKPAVQVEDRGRLQVERIVSDKSLRTR